MEDELMVNTATVCTRSPSASRSPAFEFVVDGLPVFTNQQIDVGRAERLGFGAYGYVEKGTLRNEWEAREVAIKYAINLNMRKSLLREAKSMAEIDHPNCVRIYGLFHSPENGHGVVMEYMNCGSLADLVDQKSITYTIDHVVSWMYQMSDAIQFFHKQNMVHRDVKLQNMLLHDHYRVLKICDFGTFTAIKTDMTMNRGSPITMAPEVFITKSYNTKSDVYSLGIIMWQLIARSYPYPRTQEIYQLMWNVASGLRPGEIRCSPILSTVYKRCWAHDPTQRPSSFQVREFFGALKKRLPRGSDPIFDTRSSKSTCSTPVANGQTFESEGSNSSELTALRQTKAMIEAVLKEERKKKHERLARLNELVEIRDLTDDIEHLRELIQKQLAGQQWRQ